MESAKLTQDQAMFVKSLIDAKVDLKIIAAFFDMTRNSIKKIESNKSWKTAKSIDQHLYDYIRSPEAQIEVYSDSVDWTCPVSLTYAMERMLILHTKLFQLEDAVRNPNLSNEEIGQLKKKIDALNGLIRPRLINGISDLLKQILCKQDPSAIDETSTKDYKAR